MRSVRGVKPDPSGQVSFPGLENARGSRIEITIRAGPAIETVQRVEAFREILEVGFVNAALFHLLDGQLVFSRAAVVAIQRDPVGRSTHRLEGDGTCVETFKIVVGGDFAQRVEIPTGVNGQDCVETTALGFNRHCCRVRGDPRPPERA